MDGHQHAHVAPNVWNVFISSLSDFGIKLTRLPIEIGLNSDTAEFKLGQPRLSFYKQVQKYTEAAKMTLPVDIKGKAQSFASMIDINCLYFTSVKYKL